VQRSVGGVTMSIAAMAEQPMVAIDTQRTGRMGELIVELELLKRGWTVGNFNHTTLNSAGYDLFATRGTRAVKLRVKAKRPGITNFRWAAKADGRVFVGDSGQDDFVTAVSIGPDSSYRVYVLPTGLVEETLSAEHSRWLNGAKAGGGQRKDTPMRSIYLDDRADDAPSHGFNQRWAAFEGAWHLLDET
jgi:hypothetical protein